MRRKPGVDVLVVDEAHRLKGQGKGKVAIHEIAVNLLVPTQAIVTRQPPKTLDSDA